jgi:predicted ester cyclase
VYLRCSHVHEPGGSRWKTKALSSQFTDLFNTGDREAAETLLAPQVTFHGGSAGEFTTRDALLDMISDYRAMFPDAHSTVDDQIAAGDRVVTRWTATGQVPTATLRTPRHHD